ncbi:hypothetical protein MKX07_008512 [Trichoderma sp. CBMAI-0711]|nr:hypothetical protein MKX07_008512 [Trichoderma sp. CBMAI-0711]
MSINEGARDDCLFGLRRRRQDGHEGARELEPLADGLRDEDEEVGGGGHAAAEEREEDAADEVKGRAGDDGPFQAARVRYGEAGGGAGDGGDGRGKGEAEAGGGGA